MREMQRREQRRLVAGIERRHKVVEHGECDVHRFLVGPDLGLVDGDGCSPLG
jgi:hypothetical protein